MEDGQGEQQHDHLVALQKSLRVVERHVKEQTRLFEQIATGDEEATVNCLNFRCPHKRTLKKTLRDTIEVLERTRNSFKSTQLAKLRKHLVGVLADLD